MWSFISLRPAYFVQHENQRKTKERKWGLKIDMVYFFFLPVHPILLALAMSLFSVVYTRCKIQNKLKVVRKTNK